VKKSRVFHEVIIRFHSGPARQENETVSLFDLFPCSVSPGTEFSGELNTKVKQNKTKQETKHGAAGQGRAG